MSNCTSCGGFVTDPFNLNTSNTNVCSCNTNGLVTLANPPEPECCVESVNGKNRVVSLSTTDIPEGENLYYTDARSKSAINATSPIVYNSNTGAITHAQSILAPGTYGGTNEYPIFTIDEFGHITAVTEQPINREEDTIGPDLTAIEGLTGTGYLVRTGLNTWALRGLSAASGRIWISDPDGVNGLTVIDLAYSGVVAGVYGGLLSYPVITVDAYGRITAVNTQSISTPPLPPHTHTLGSLSNVANDADTAAQTDEALVWTGSQFETAYPKNEFSSYAITLATNWNAASGNADVNTLTLNDPINYVRVETGVDGKKLVSIHAVLYALFSIIEAGAQETFHPSYNSLSSLRCTPKLIGTLPIEAHPLHNLDIALPAYFAANSYWNTTHTTQFSGNQFFVSMNLRINTVGELWLNCVLLPDLISTTATIGDAEYILAPIVVTYLTDVITD